MSAAQELPLQVGRRAVRGSLHRAAEDLRIGTGEIHMLEDAARLFFFSAKKREVTPSGPMMINSPGLTSRS